MINLRIVAHLSSAGWNPRKSEIDLLLDKEFGHVIAAHELAHCRLKHPLLVGATLEQLWSQELEAWALAKKWLKSAGEWTAEAKFFVRMTINTYRSECFALAPISREREAIEEIDKLLS